MLGTKMRLLTAALLISPPQAVLAQTPHAAAAQPAQTAAPASCAAITERRAARCAGRADRALSRCAVAEILMASTYPLEVVEADRWARANKSLKGDALKAAVDKQSWDDSVKSLVATPSVLDMMSEKLDWTQKLGDAVLAQQPDVMDAIQRLRTKAQANNKLASNKQQTVSTQQQDGKQVIVIAPTQSGHDLRAVLRSGRRLWRVALSGLSALLLAGARLYRRRRHRDRACLRRRLCARALGSGGGYWGGGFNWGGNNINVNRNVNINNINRGNGNNWAHNPAHRQGVRYNNANVAAKFGGNRNNIAGGAQNRMDFRGRSRQQVLNPGAGGGNRPNRPSGRGNAGKYRRREPAEWRQSRRIAAVAAVIGPRGGGANRPSPVAAIVQRRRRSRGPGNAFGNISSGRAASWKPPRPRQSRWRRRRAAEAAACVRRRRRRRGGGGGGGRGGGGGGRRSDCDLSTTSCCSASRRRPRLLSLRL